MALTSPTSSPLFNPLLCACCQPPKGGLRVVRGDDWGPPEPPAASSLKNVSSLDQSKDKPVLQGPNPPYDYDYS